MVNRRLSDAGAVAAAPTASTPIAPVVKRRRRTSCLGEQERRERKRAIDREAQRSLREKTKAHIAELERTIQILRDQDRDGATASLLSEIDALRAENERLKEVIDSVKSVVGCEIVPRTTATNVPPPPPAPVSEPMLDAAGHLDHQSPTPMTPGPSMEIKHSTPPLLSPQSLVPEDFSPTRFEHHPYNAIPTTKIDLNGMTVVPDVGSDQHHHPLGMDMDLDAVTAEDDDSPEMPDSPATAAFAPYIAEMFGSSWRCPNPVILHLHGAEAASSSLTSSAVDPGMEKESQLPGKVFNYWPSAGERNFVSVESDISSKESDSGQRGSHSPERNVSLSKQHALSPTHG